jgi:hypothetical protein
MLAERLLKRIGGQERGVVEIKRSHYFDAGKNIRRGCFFEF